jgi:molybdopterin converting factor small subunit
MAAPSERCSPTWMQPILASTTIYVNDSDIRFAQGLDTPIAERDEVSIVPAVAGGGGRR